MKAVSDVLFRLNVEDIKYDRLCKFGDSCLDLIFYIPEVHSDVISSRVEEFVKANPCVNFGDFLTSVPFAKSCLWESDAMKDVKMADVLLTGSS